MRMTIVKAGHQRLSLTANHAVSLFFRPIFPGIYNISAISHHITFGNRPAAFRHYRYGVK